MANGYAKLHQRLDRLEQQLQTLIDQQAATPPAETPPPAPLAPQALPSEVSVSTPFAEGAATAANRLAEVEGAEPLKARLAEAIEQLVEAETLESLIHLAQLAPKLEYAATLVAAGPELLEEALEMAEGRLAAFPDLSRQLRTLGPCLAQLANDSTIQLLRELLEALPALAPILRTVTHHIAAERAAVPAEQLGEQLGELAAEALNPETLHSLTFLTAHLPKIQYAIEATAGSEALYRGTLKVVRQHVHDVPDALEKLEDGLNTLQQLLGSTDLDRLVKLSALLTSADSYQTLQDLSQFAPQLTRALHALPVQEGTLDMLQTLNQAVERATETPQEVGAFGMLRAFSNPEVRRAAGFALQVAQALGAHLQPKHDIQLQDGDN